MSNSGLVRDPVQCQEKQALIDQIRVLFDEIASLHDSELEAALVGNPLAHDLYSNRLREATSLKMLLVRKIGQHVIAHGC